MISQNLKLLDREPMVLRATNAQHYQFMRAHPMSQWKQVVSPHPASACFIHRDVATFVFPGESYRRHDGVTVEVLPDRSVRRVTPKPVSKKRAKRYGVAYITKKQVEKGNIR